MQQAAIIIICLLQQKTPYNLVTLGVSSSRGSGHISKRHGRDECRYLDFHTILKVQENCKKNNLICFLLLTVVLPALFKLSTIPNIAKEKGEMKLGTVPSIHHS